LIKLEDDLILIVKPGYVVMANRSH